MLRENSIDFEIMELYQTCYGAHMGTISGRSRTFFGLMFMGKQALILENLALKQQLGVYLRKGKCPARLKLQDRVFWVLPSKIWDGWKSPLVLVKPDTVIDWHRQGFKTYWRWRSRTNKVGRPRITRKHIEFIKRISRENPGWGVDQINRRIQEFDP